MPTLTPEVYAGTGSTGLVNGDRLTTAQFSLLEGLSWHPDAGTDDGLYVGDYDNHVIRRIDAGSGQVTTWKAFDARIEAIHWAPDGSALYVSEVGDHQLAKVRHSDQALLWTRETGYLGNAPREHPDGKVYFIDGDSGDPARHLRYCNASDGLGMAYAATYIFTQGEELAIDADGDLWVADFGAGQLLHIAYGTWTKTVKMTGLGGAQAVVVRAGLVYVGSRTAGAVWVYDPVGGGNSQLTTTLNQPNSIDFGPDGLLYVADGGARQVKRLTPPQLGWVIGSVAISDDA